MSRFVLDINISIYIYVYNINKYTTLVGEVDDGEGHVCVGA